MSDDTSLTQDSAVTTEETIARSIHLRPLPKSFDIHKAMMKLKQKDGMSKDYLTVQWRLVWFRELCPTGTIDTQELEFDLDREIEIETYVWDTEKKRSEKGKKKAKGYARYRAIIEDGMGGRATGTKDESAVSFPDFGPKAETGAIGRALAALGFGTQFAIELDEEDRIVDSPVDRSPTRRTAGGRTIPERANEARAEHGPAHVERRDQQEKNSHESPNPPTNSTDPQAASEPQKESLRTLYGNLIRLGATIEEPTYENLTYQGAKEIITAWSGRWRDLKAIASSGNRQSTTQKH